MGKIVVVRFFFCRVYLRRSRSHDSRSPAMIYVKTSSQYDASVFSQYQK